jgi:hypothetical protein
MRGPDWNLSCRCNPPPQRRRPLATREEDDWVEVIPQSRGEFQRATAVSSRPTLIASPRDDEVFQDLAEAMVAAGANTPGALQEALRSRYPKAVVRARDLSGERGVIWYVYRDGRWTRSGKVPGG